MAIRHRIFDSYFTTKPVGVGTGIGLSISKAIVERHKGTIRFEEVVPTGARFVVELPAFAGAHTGVAAQETRSSGLRHALIIDDEPDVAASLSDILELMGVKSRIITAWSSQDAVLADYRTRYRFQRSAHAGGKRHDDLSRNLSRRAPTWRAVSCWSPATWSARAPRSARYPAHERPLVLEKPFSTLDVRSALAAVNDQVTLAS